MFHAEFKPKGRAGNLLAQFNLESGGLAQQVLDRRVVDYAQPYVPWQTGTLARSPYAVNSFGSGRIIYPGPYAHYQYMGEVYGPNIPIVDSASGLAHFVSPKGQKKHPTGRQLQHDQSLNPLAGPFWIERMKADRMDDILKEVVAVVKNSK